MDPLQRLQCADHLRRDRVGLFQRNDGVAGQVGGRDDDLDRTAPGPAARGDRAEPGGERRRRGRVGDIDLEPGARRARNRDIDRLVDLKREMVRLIKAVDYTEYQTLLELRYLCFKTWEQIAVDLNYSIHHLYKLHNAALDICDRLLQRDT